jgi:hypothetical protein
MRHTSLTTCIILVVTGLLVLLLSACAPSAAPATSAAPESTADVTFDIPPGTEAALDRGEPGFQFPEDIQLKAGQSVLVANHDYAMHYFFDIPIAPEQTIRKPFPRAGSFVYQGGMSCSISRTNTIKVHVE